MKTQSRMLIVGALLVGAPISHGPLEAQGGPGMDAWGITAVPGLELGHHTLSERPTGCTVVLARAGAVGGVDVRGTFRVWTNANVVGHNAPQAREGGPQPVYQWVVKSLRDPPPKLVLQLQ